MSSLSSLPDALLYHALTFVGENDDARCAGLDKSWARLRRVWVICRLSKYPFAGTPGTLTRRTGQVIAAAFSCDGKLLAVGAKDDVLTVYDAATGALQRTFARGECADCVAFSPTDSTVLAAGGDRGIITCNVATGESCQVWRAADFFASDSVAYSPDASTIAFCGYDLAAVIDIDGVRGVGPARVLATSDGLSIHGAAFSPTGSVLAVGIGTKVKCFDLATGHVRSEIEHGVDVWSVAYSPLGTVSAGGDFGKVAFYDASTGQLQRELRSVSPEFSSRGQSVLQSCFSPDGSTFASQGSDLGYATIAIYDAETGQLRRELNRKIGQSIGAVTFSPDGQTLAVGDYDGKVALYEVATGELRRMRRQP